MSEEALSDEQIAYYLSRIALVLKGGGMKGFARYCELGEAAIHRLTEDRDKWRLQARHETDVAAAEIEGRKSAEARIAEMEAALRGILQCYVDLVNCGDCGNWDPEKDDEVVAARAALASCESARRVSTAPPKTAGGC